MSRITRAHPLRAKMTNDGNDDVLMAVFYAFCPLPYPELDSHNLMQQSHFKATEHRAIDETS